MSEQLVEGLRGRQRKDRLGRFMDVPGVGDDELDLPEVGAWRAPVAPTHPLDRPQAEHAVANLRPGKSVTLAGGTVVRRKPRGRRYVVRAPHQRGEDAVQGFNSPDQAARWAALIDRRDNPEHPEHPEHRRGPGSPADSVRADLERGARAVFHGSFLGGEGVSFLTNLLGLAEARFAEAVAALDARQLREAKLAALARGEAELFERLRRFERGY